MKRLLLLSVFAVSACRSGSTLKPVAMVDTLPTRVGRQSWTADRNDFRLGDVIQVQIDELTVAASSTNNQASTSRDRNMTLQLAAALKGTSVGDATAGLGSGNSGSSSRNGTATRQNHFTSEMSVRIAGFSPSGMIFVRGLKNVAIDGHEQTVELSGWARPQDVSSRNLIPSSRLADVSLRYAGNGTLDAPQSGILSRVFGALWP